MAEVFGLNIALNHSVQIIHVIEDTASSQIINERMIMKWVDVNSHSKMSSLCNLMKVSLINYVNMLFTHAGTGWVQVKKWPQVRDSKSHTAYMTGDSK